MSRRSDGVPYRRSLPLAGEEGTVARRMNGTAADGRCRTKTGTLIGVSALSGYCKAGHGLVAFSFALTDVPAGAWTHLAVSIDRSTNHGRWYLNGSPAPAAFDFVPLAGESWNRSRLG